MFSWFKKFTLQTKLLLAFTFVCTFVVLVGGTSYYFGQRTVRDYRKIALKNLPSSIVAAGLRGTAKDLRSTIFRMGLADAGPDELQTLHDKIGEVSSQYTEAEIEYAALTFTEGEEALFSATKEKWSAWISIANKMAELRVQNKPEGLKEFSDILREDFRNAANQYFEVIGALVSFHQQQARLNREAAEHSEKIGNWSSAAAIVFGFFCALAIGVISGRQISRILLKISESLGLIVERVGSASNEINQISKNLSSAVQEQAAALQETSSAVTEISSTLDKTSEGALRSQQLSDKSQREIESGKAVIEALVGSVENLRDSSHKMVKQVDENNQSIDSLVKVIQEIGNKTKVINEIVFQTKLLSFNASVEAARAGEAGKGFAVVAEEVGNLAQMSGTSASEISTMLNAGTQQVETIARESKAMMAAVTTEIDSQLKTVLSRIQACEDSFSNIFQSTTAVAHDMGDICAATNEQNVGMKEISTAMHQLTSSTDLNAEASEKAAHAATDLQKEIKNLETSIRELQTTVSGSSESQLLKETKKASLLIQHEKEDFVDRAG
jgi:methyl-accepting chemotaxis protein